MKLIEAIRLALQSLWGNKMRSILTLLGVVIGVASVITVVTLTNGAKEFVTTKINTYGADVVTVSKMPQTFHHHRRVSRLSEAQGRNIRRLQSHSFRLQVVRVGRARSASRRERSFMGQESTTDTDIRGWTWTMPAISNLNIALGRSYTEVEDSTART
jgi:putative ABC transport system permease protein